MGPTAAAAARDQPLHVPDLTWSGPGPGWPVLRTQPGQAAPSGLGHWLERFNVFLRALKLSLSFIQSTLETSLDRPEGPLSLDSLPPLPCHLGRGGRYLPVCGPLPCRRAQWSICLLPVSSNTGGCPATALVTRTDAIIPRPCCSRGSQLRTRRQHCIFHNARLQCRALVPFDRRQPPPCDHACVADFGS